MTLSPEECHQGMHFPLHCFEALSELTPADIRDLQRLGEAAVTRRRGEVIWQEGQQTEGFHLLLRGWVFSSILLRNGKRLIQKLHLPGDILGSTSVALPAAADTLTALTDVATSFVHKSTLRVIFETNPKISALIFLVSQMERVALMDALASAGRSNAMENMTHLLLDLHCRLDALGAVKDDRFYLPVTQEMIGDMLGFTTVHVNRVLNQMVKGGLIEIQGRYIKLTNLQVLRELSPLPPRKPLHEPAWLPIGKGSGTKVSLG